jgi:hypothetical protein
VPLLAANLRTAAGQRPFAASRIVEVAGERVGLFAVVGPGPLPDGLAADDPAAAARAEAASLRAAGATLVVALLHLGTVEARALVEGGLPVDLAVAAHDARPVRPEAIGPTLFAEPLGRGKDLPTVAIHLATRGPWADLAAPGRAAAEGESIRGWIATARDRLSRATADADRKTLKEFIAVQEERMADAERRARIVPAGRLFEPAVNRLEEEAPEDTVTVAEVAGVVAVHGEPPGDE